MAKIVECVPNFSEGRDRHVSQRHLFSLVLSSCFLFSAYDACNCCYFVHGVVVVVVGRSWPSVETGFPFRTDAMLVIFPTDVGAVLPFDERRTKLERNARKKIPRST